MICLTPKPNQKNLRNHRSLWLPSSPDLNPLDYAMERFRKPNKCNFPTIGLFKTVIEKEWNKISEEFILKACKSFRRRIDTIIEKNGDHIE